MLIINSSEYLWIFLLKKLDSYEAGPKSVIIGTFILESMLCEYDLLELNPVKQIQPHKNANLIDTQLLQLTLKIKTFLKANHSKLYNNTVYSLLKEHAQNELLLFYAELIQDWGYACEIHIGAKSWSSILSILSAQVQSY